MNGGCLHAHDIASQHDGKPNALLPGHAAPLRRQSAHRSAVTRVVAASASDLRGANSRAPALADVAAGRFDAFWETRLKAWDMEAGIVLIREAGGIVTDLQGADVQAAHTGIVAGGPQMHAWLLRTVQQAL